MNEQKMNKNRNSMKCEMSFFKYWFGIIVAVMVSFCKTKKSNNNELIWYTQTCEIKCYSQIASVGDNSCTRARECVSVCVYWGVIGLWTFLFMKSGWIFNCLHNVVTIIDAISHCARTHTQWESEGNEHTHVLIWF